MSLKIFRVSVGADILSVTSAENKGDLIYIPHFSLVFPFSDSISIKLIIYLLQALILVCQLKKLKSCNFISASLARNPWKSIIFLNMHVLIHEGNMSKTVKCKRRSVNHVKKLTEQNLKSVTLFSVAGLRRCSLLKGLCHGSPVQFV